MGGNSRFVSSERLQNCTGGMASGGDGLTSPARSSADGLFGGPDVDFGSVVPSLSFAESDVGNKSELMHVEPEPSSKVNFGHLVGASWNSLDAETVEPSGSAFLETRIWEQTWHSSLSARHQSRPQQMM